MKNTRLNQLTISLGLIILMLITVRCDKSKDPDDPPSDGTVMDIDGNVYHTVIIGTQVWMVENLKTTKYNDGTTIRQKTSLKSETGWEEPYFCWYNNDPSNKNNYGALYNFWVFHNDLLVQHELAPAGWHIPTREEWLTLINYLGGDSIAGGKMKSLGTIEEGTGLWKTPNFGASNESGFSVLPGGICIQSNPLTFEGMGDAGYFWTSTFEQVYPYSVSFSSDNKSAYVGYPWIGFNFLSIRCIKD